MQNRIAVFALIVLLMLIGRALTGRRIVPEHSADTLNRVVLYVNLPAALLLYASRLKPGVALLGTIAVPRLLLAFSVGVVLLLATLPVAMTGASASARAARSRPYLMLLPGFHGCCRSTTSSCGRPRPGSARCTEWVVAPGY